MRLALLGLTLSGSLALGAPAALGQPDDVAPRPTAPGPAAPVPDAQRSVDAGETAASWEWIRGQLGTGTPVVGTSRIAADADYPSAWTGPVSGRVELAPGDVPEGAEVEVRAFVVTDTWYPAGSAHVRPDGTFGFDWIFPGAKVFQLRAVADGRVLAEAAPATGLVRSFDAPDGHPLVGRTFTYDQALALLAAHAEGEEDTAAVLADGLGSLQRRGGAEDGAFVTQAAALDPTSATPEVRTGVHAVATYALLRHLRTLAPDDPRRDEVQARAERAVRWLLGQQVPAGDASPGLAGLVLGGVGAWRADVGFDADARLPWASTEHNLDTWHTLRLAQDVLDLPEVGPALDALGPAVLTSLWSTEEDGFLQGRQPDGPDPTPALDVNAWGAIALLGMGEQDRAARSLARTAPFAATDGPVSGYGPVPTGGTPLVWVEGSAGVALAQARAGDADGARETLAGLTGLRGADGGYRAASRNADSLSMTTLPAVGGTAWVVLATHGVAGRPSIWDDVSGAGPVAGVDLEEEAP